MAPRGVLWGIRVVGEAGLALGRHVGQEDIRVVARVDSPRRDWLPDRVHIRVVGEAGLAPT